MTGLPDKEERDEFDYDFSWDTVRPIPQFIVDDHALNHNRPFPCGYCSKYAGNARTEDNLANIVTDFGVYVAPNGKEWKEECIARFTAPTERGNCVGFTPIMLDYRKPCDPSIFTYLESNYMMECISKIYEHSGITVTEVLDRQRKGYNTRTQRINELLELEWIEQEDDRLYITDRGDRIAKAVRDLYDAILTDQQEGNILDDEDYANIFQFIDEHRGCSTKWIYEQMREGTKTVTSNNDEYLDTTPADAFASVILRTLHEKGYISGEFDEKDWNTIRYTTTERGKRAWKRKSER